MGGRRDGLVQVAELFHSLADQSDVERTVILNKLKSTDPDTYALLATLLKADSNPNVLFGNSPQQVLEEWTKDPELVGEQIGAFRLDEIVGQGAMGSVFRASRVDGQFEQVVAIKLLKSQMLSSSHREFFERERQILAKLNHPGIARLYDGGFVEDGRPFFTMEWISGHSLTRYAKLNKCTLQERIGLFLQVCDAIRYAHQSLIIHLDLKPANIIVNDQGMVKLLDFGVSRLLEDKLDQAGSFTLAYASPEQIRHENPTTVSDIYSLGVILFELLTGKHPFEEGFQDMKLLNESILEGKFGAFELDESLSQANFREDLKRICAKAMKVDSAFRYGSVDEFVGDLRAFKEDYPISVREREWGYVGRKYFRRNQKVLASISVGLVLLFGTGIFYTLQLREQRNIAESEAKKANQITELLTDVFLAADPNVGGADTLTAVNLLDQGLAQLEKNLGDDPELYANMLIRLSSIYYNLGQYDKGTSTSKEAYDLLLLSPESNVSLLVQAENQFAKSFYYYGDLDSAEIILRMALDRISNSKISDPELLAAILADYGNVKIDLGMLVEADSLYKLSHAYYLELSEGPNIDLAFTLHMMGSTARDLGDFTEAEKYLMQSLAMKKELFNEPHLEIAYTYNYLGSLYQSKNENDKALDYITESYEQRNAILGKFHVETMASLANMGRTFNRLERFEEAIDIYNETIEVVDSLFGQKHYYTAGLIGNQSNSYIGLGDYETAKAKIKVSQELYQEWNPSNLLGQAPPLIKLGEIAELEGDPNLARDYYEKALTIRAASLPKGHFQIAQSQQTLGQCLLGLGDYPTAIEYLELALDSFKSNPEISEKAIISVNTSLVEAYEGINDLEKASYYKGLLADQE